MVKSLVAITLAVSLALVAPARSQQGHENTFPTIQGMWEQDAHTGQCFYHPPPPQVARILMPCPPSMAPPSSSAWDNFTQQQIADFERQCYVAARTEALKIHKRFCLYQELIQKPGSLSMSGMALVTDTMDESRLVETPIISITCDKNWLGNIGATITILSEATEQNWGLMNNCHKY